MLRVCESQARSSLWQCVTDSVTVFNKAMDMQRDDGHRRVMKHHVECMIDEHMLWYMYVYFNDSILCENFYFLAFFIVNSSFIVYQSANN